MLYFAEEVYLLALNEETGRIHINQNHWTFSATLTGATLCDLMTLKRVTIDASGKLTLVNNKTTHVPHLDLVLTELQQCSKKEIELSNCLGCLLDLASKIEKLIVKSLIEKEIISEKEDRILWLIPRHHYIQKNTTEIMLAEQRLHQLITDESLTPSESDRILLSLTNSCGLLTEILSPKELQRHKQRINQLANSNPIGSAIYRTLTHVNLTPNTSPFN